MGFSPLMNIQSFQPNLLKKNSLSSLICLCTFVKNPLSIYVYPFLDSLLSCVIFNLGSNSSWCSGPTDRLEMNCPYSTRGLLKGWSWFSLVGQFSLLIGGWESELRKDLGEVLLELLVVSHEELNIYQLIVYKLGFFLFFFFFEHIDLSGKIDFLNCFMQRGTFKGVD